VEWQEVFQALRQLNYAGRLTIEGFGFALKDLSAGGGHLARHRAHAGIHRLRRREVLEKECSGTRPIIERQVSCGHLEETVGVEPWGVSTPTVVNAGLQRPLHIFNELILGSYWPYWP
jgi:hypothetical protein